MGICGKKEGAFLSGHCGDFYCRIGAAPTPMMPPSLVFIDNGQLVQMKSWRDIVDLGTSQIKVPRTHAVFNNVIDSKTFTGKGDRGKVKQLYAETFKECFEHVDRFRWLEEGIVWTAAEAEEVGAALAGFPHVKTLDMTAYAATAFREFA